jgi:hypothetical protein
MLVLILLILSFAAGYGVRSYVSHRRHLRQLRRRSAIFHARLKRLDHGAPAGRGEARFRAIEPA